MERGGCVYITRTDPDFGEAPGRWKAHWEKPVTSSESWPTMMPWRDAVAEGLVEEGEWATVDEAIAWGRARCDRVLVYLAHDIDSIYSAGAIHETAGPSPGGSGRWPVWPPPSNVWSGGGT